MLDEKLLVFVLGAPGAGKGTQCDLIVKEYGWTHISAGDLLREQVAAGTPAGKEAEEYLKQGTMVPASMIIGLLKEALSDAQHTKVLIDGFPRVLDQLQEFERQVRPCDKALFYNVAEETARERLLKRGETSGRVDDNAETIRKRFVVFKEESMPVITELEAEGRVAEIDAAQSPEQVFAATRVVIQQLQQQQQDKAQNTQPKADEVEPSIAVEETSSVALAAAAAAAGSETAAAPVPGSPAAAVAGQAPKASATPTAVSPVAAAATPAVNVPVSPAAGGAEAQIVSPRQLTLLGAAGTGLPTTSVSAATVVAALPAAAAAMAAASSPQKPTAAGAGAGAVSPAAAGAGAVSPAAAAAPAGTLAPLSMPASPAALAAAVEDPMSPASAATAVTLASLQVDLSGIRTPVVVCGPSGVGKGTLISKLMAQFGDRFGFSISHTTRAPRPGEAHGKHYYFTEKDAMASQVAAGMFLEHAVVHGNMYGTSLAAVAHVSAAGKHCVLDIDVQGAAQVRKSALGHHCLFIFVAPPSHEELERRLRNRGTETEDKVLQRLANAQSEIAKAQEPGLFHHVLVNADLEVAYQELLKLIDQRVPGLITISTQQEQQQQQSAGAGGSQRTSEAGGTAATAPTSEAAGACAAAAAAAAAGGGAAVVAAAAAAAGGMAVAAHQPQQQQQPQLQPVLVNGSNGNISINASGGTATLLDFGFGASAGPAVAAKGMPVRQYMDTTVIPVLREGLKALNVARPDDPLQFLADYLVSHKTAVA